MSKTLSGLNWREENGIIYFSVTSDGTSGREWIVRLKEKGIDLMHFVEDLLMSNNFKPSRGVITEIEVMKVTLEGKGEGPSVDIGVGNFPKPYEGMTAVMSAEVGCLIREALSDEELTKEMGLMMMIIMHSPIDTGNGARYLAVTFQGGNPQLIAFVAGPRLPWNGTVGFAFTISSN